MNVICRTNHRGYNQFTKGKTYQVVAIYTYSDYTMKWIKSEVTNNEVIFIPKKAEFYIEVINDCNRYSTFWNNFFLSTQEIRKMKIEKLSEI